MLQKKLSFESENLVVDWIGFNIQGSVDLKPIAKYLFEAFGFNSTIAKRINGKWKSESLNYDRQNQFQVSFYELQVKLQIIQCMSTNSLEKVFHAKDFLDQFNVSTQKQANIKKLIVESFHQLQHHNRIKNKFKLVTQSGKVQETNKLVPLRIGQSKIIRFYEIL